jgi:hypothetical protein
VGTRITGMTDQSFPVCQADAHSVYQDLLQLAVLPTASAWSKSCASGCHDFVGIGIEAGHSRLVAFLTPADGEALASHILQQVERAREARLSSAPPAPIPPHKKGPTDGR